MSQATALRPEHEVSYKALENAVGAFEGFDGFEEITTEVSYNGAKPPRLVISVSPVDLDDMLGQIDALCLLNELAYSKPIKNIFQEFFVYIYAKADDIPLDERRISI